MQFLCRSRVFTRAEVCTPGTKENLYLPLYITYILKLYTFHSLEYYFVVILTHFYILSLLSHINQHVKVIIIRNVFIWNRQVNCMLLYNLHLKESLWFSRFQNSALPTKLWQPWSSISNTECSSLGFTGIPASSEKKHRPLTFLSWCFREDHSSPATISGMQAQALAASVLAGGWIADSFTDVLLYRIQEARGEAQSFVSAHDLYSKESLF